MSELYLYGFLPSAALWPAELAGLAGAEVERVAVGPVAAAVSALPADALRPTRRFLIAHDAVVQRLAAAGAMLPAAFGTATERGALEALLSAQGAAFAARLARLEGQVEMGLKLLVGGDNVFETLLAQNPEIAAERARLLTEGASHSERLAMGQRVAGLLESERARLSAWLAEALAPAVTEVLREDPRGDAELASLALLVPSQGEPGFLAALEAAAAELPDAYRLEYRGPMPPYSFARLAPDGAPATP
jgi:Gas vesicle synthesis protein GvpL/GvpF